LTTLNSFYDLHLTDDWKDKLVDCLTESHLKNPMDGGAFVTEVPALIFSLFALTTKRNIHELRSLVEGLSLVYITSIGERLDIASASHMMFAWTETQSFNPEICDKMIEICMEKEKADCFYEAGCSTELINIIKSM
jgi:hypothetical protein